MATFTRRMMLDTVLSAAVAGVFVRPASAGSQVGATARQRWPDTVVAASKTSAMLERMMFILAHSLGSHGPWADARWPSRSLARRRSHSELLNASSQTCRVQA